MVALLGDPQLIVAFFTLTALELVLGIDNIIFISILVDKLPRAQRQFARRLGLFLAMFMRIGLLAALSWLAGMTAPLFTVPVLEHGLSGRDLILAAGGLFLVWKSTREVHQLLEGEEGPNRVPWPAPWRPSSPRSSSSTWCSRSTPSSPPSAWSATSVSWSPPWLPRWG
ncbi:TerC family protein [Nitrogeniibacter mangrovi]|uniref:TerC family protein n=1 Tax=Nitrogeniibacter mangrovi TaxID=2016596 RepID=UPI00226AB2FC|nr:hypothetical protein [Nitrogeniibacter mangrovi]